MRRPNDEEIAAAKAIARAATNGASDAVELLELEDLDVALLVRPMTPPEWGQYVDAEFRHRGDAQAAAFVSYVLWPRPVEADALVRATPDLPRIVAGELAKIAGIIPKGRAQIEPLSAETPAQTLEAIGLPAARASELLAQYPAPRQLSIVRFQRIELALVMKRPSKAMFDALNDRIQEAAEETAGFARAARPAIVDCVVWSPEPIDRILDRYPALVTGGLFGAVRRLGGAGATVDRKRL